MEELPSQPDRKPMAARDASPAEGVPQSEVLEYRGDVPQLPDTSQPWYIILAAVIVYAAAGNLIALGGITLCVWMLDGLGVLGISIALLLILFGLGMLGLEYEAESERSRACTLIVGTAALLLAVPLGMHARTMMLANFDELYLRGGLTALAVFCAIAHFLWAARIPRLSHMPQSISGEQRV